MTSEEIVLYLEENGFCQFKKTQTFEKYTIQNSENILILVYLESPIDKTRVSFVLKNEGHLYTFEFVLKMSSIKNIERVIKMGIASVILMKMFYKIETENASISIESKKLFDINMIKQFYCVDEYGYLYLPTHNLPLIKSFARNKREYFQLIKNSVYSQEILVDDLLDGKYNDKTLEIFPK
jgi:hypothetical protein